MTAHLAAELLYVDVEDDAVVDMRTRSRPLPPGVTARAGTRLENPIRVVDTKQPPTTPLFRPVSNVREERLEAVHNLFDTLAVVSREKHTARVQTYHEYLQYWIEHYTSVAPPTRAELAEVVPHPKRPAHPYGPHDEDAYFYQRIKLNTRPYLLRIGEHREVTA